MRYVLPIVFGSIAAFLAWQGVANWGWFLFIAVLTTDVVGISRKEPS